MTGKGRLYRFGRTLSTTSLAAHTLTAVMSMSLDPTTAAPPAKRQIVGARAGWDYDGHPLLSDCRGKARELSNY
ncbi:hypothetical protein P175DRAFT_0530054 [Aspergillus ochraceoroseus IBT 24754]|uniref:Uncharacterized protein n=1 Tax=Aspergillus ochraceoroseus IBT 24754 TaxID=1392256 RepID=A0A2T5M360_9EURO|nr:uncharacterized protein P175DRAFT_0530054 [Aspergillus ochraceoroseus IBT 24754]PTU22967.1 hypothetical protein P175DRAFT_0530054 [Aspergillus ochraceoroseus IBT 24754]